MKTISIIIIIILFIFLVGGILFVYFKYEKPQEENKVYLIDLSILAKSGDNIIRTNYTIFVNGYYFGSGVTEYDYVLNRVPFNSSITVINSNLPGQRFYKNRLDFYTDKNETTRVVLNLISVGNLTIITNNSNYKINTTVFSNGYFKNPIICLYWSTHVIFAEIENISRTTTLENTTKCYQFQTLDNSNISFVVDYSTFGKVNENDYIDIIFYDFDEVYTIRQIYRNNNI